MRVVVSGGGTGGHIFPALAVVEAMQRQDVSGAQLYIGATTGMETGIVPQRGVEFRAVTAQKLRKVASPSTIGVLASLVKGYGEARRHLREWRAEAVVGSGGYVAAATVLAGAKLGLPTLILAPDLVPGRTNLLLSRWAKRICVSFDESVPKFPTGRTLVTGFPLRQGIVLSREVTKQEARCAFEGLERERFTVAVVGGSQGARAVNAIVIEAARTLTQSGVQILHATGPKNFDMVREQTQNAGLLASGGYVALPFLDDRQMPLAFRACDVIVCRGGMSTLSEVTANGLPSLIIPLPTAYADHQTANAKALERAGAARHLAEVSLTGSALAGAILELRNDVARRQAMSEQSRTLGKPSAADTVAKLVLELPNRN